VTTGSSQATPRLRAVILVGGEGTRLRPLTFTRPKPILPVAGIPMLTRKLEHLAQFGVTDAVLSLGYKPDAFLKEFPTGMVGGVKVHYAVEPSPLDTGGAIRFAAEEAGFLDGSPQPIIAVNGDTLTGDLGALLAFHLLSGAEATIALTQVEDPSAFGVVPIDADGRVLAFVEKPPRGEAPTDWINAGTYVLEPRFFARIPNGERISIERGVFPALVAEGTLFAAQDTAWWIDAGIPTTYVEANLHQASEESADGVVLGANCTIDASASVVTSVLGTGCSVALGASITNSVIGDGVSIGAGARLDYAIIGNDVTIGAGSILTNYCVIGDGATVEPATVFDGTRFPMPAA
jgi:mannose-1-phosphate guanylyltransferase